MSTNTSTKANSTVTTSTTTLATDTGLRPQPTERGSFGFFRNSLTLTWRSLIKTMRTPEALIDVTLQPAIFLLIFVYIFGGAVSGSTHEYLQFLLPGILAQTIAMGAIAIGVNLNTDLEKGIFDRFRSLPIARSAPLVGAVFGDVVRYVVVIASTMVVGTLMGFRVQTDPAQFLLACLLAVVFALCLSWISVFVGMVVRTSGAVQGVMFLVMMPLAFGSNIFVQTQTLPGWLQSFVNVNPLTHLVGAMRGLMLGTPLEGSITWTLVWCAGFVACFLPAALWAYRRRV